MGSGSTFQSSSEIKEFYYDDVLGNSFDTSLDRQHLSLQIPGLDVLSSSSISSQVNGDVMMSDLNTDKSHCSRTSKRKGVNTELVHVGRMDQSSASGYLFITVAVHQAMISHFSCIVTSLGM